ncbi:tRNA (adenosine(37)-N6)-dimethylallyltransferase MiaA [Candidatus Parcubacteria bacterium]|nr:tRNA (adenosine(37)-N6)-dimethylallyltransferase MiaA [Candidatus Parcubacteria bacterium]
MSKPKVIAVVGPTSSGKTSLGMYLAKKFKGEVISADSRQVYKGLNLGTGKVTKKEMQGVPHHLLNVANPKKQFSADDFLKLGKKILPKIKVPIIVGGTGFYIDALLGQIVLPQVPPNEKLRAELEKKSAPELLTMLKELDPRRALTIEPEHKRRIIRAIEIAKVLGANPIPTNTNDYDVLWLGLNPNNLEKRIHERLFARLKLGMIAEAKRLHKAGLSYKRMEELGLEYRYMARLLTGMLTKQEFEAELEREIKNYAKRQMRWFKRNKNIHWIKNKSDAIKLAKAFISS